MAGYDLISTWSPRVGASGDDLYNMPDETEYEFGAVSYSVPPTIAEIDAGDHINQIIAAYNRRAYYYNLTFGTTLKIFPYLYDSSAMAESTCTSVSTSGDFRTVTTSAAHGYVGGEIVYMHQTSTIVRTYVVYDVPTTTTFRIVHMSVALTTGVVVPTNDVSALFILGLSDAINDLRVAEGFATYTFSTAEFIPGADIENSHIFELRKSLRISGVLTKTSNLDVAFYGRSGLTYPTWSALSSSYTSNPGGTIDVGKLGQTTFMARQRMLSSFNIPEWYAGADSALVRAVLSAKDESMEAIAALDLYRSNTDDDPPDTSVPPAGSMANTDNLEDSYVNPANGSHDFTLDESGIVGDQQMSYIFGTKDEIDGTGVYSVINRSDIFITVHPQLIIDFGT